MKAIGNIYVTWRKGKGSRRIPIGIIKKNIIYGVRFSYITKGVNEAKELGFTSYDGFPNLQKTYTENIIEIFGQRIVRSERNDIDDFYNFWKIDKTYKDDNYYMLAYTQGILPIDNFEFLADFNPVSNLSFITEISGLSKNQVSADLLVVGDKLRYELDSKNKYDSKAVKVFKNDLFLGYIKRIHCNVFSKTKSTLKITVHHIEKNGVLNRVFLHVTK